MSHSISLADFSDFCAVAPSPQLRERLQQAAADAPADVRPLLGITGTPKHFGFNDGVIIPADRFPLGSSAITIRRAASQRAPLRGPVRVAVVLVEFSDKQLNETGDHFRELFFAADNPGSVTNYYKEVTGGLVEITGDVVGPYTMPQTLAWYANGNFGIGNPSGEPRANILAHDAAVAADADVDFTPYDNDGNGYVDAFVVVHAGSGGEETGNPGDIWSHKWVLPAEYQADATHIYAYLTIPEDAKLGVSAHELGHLLFGFPDLYDTDYTSEGIGNWCLMAGGSWNGGGDRPAHPSAWCKANQGWVSVTNVTASTSLSIDDVKNSRTVYRLWTNGAAGSEYFLLENRQRTEFDDGLPSDGLLIWHIDEKQGDNTDESHYLVGLLQADGARDLERKVNRGDVGDPFPGSVDNRKLDGTTTPSTISYSGQGSEVAVLDISDSGATMTASVRVSTTSDDGGTDDVAARLAKIESRLTQLQNVLAAAGNDLTRAGEEPSAWSARPKI